MNKKGFTLIELLTVITVLGLITIITLPTIKESFTKSEENLNKQQMTQIINATKKYMLDHSELLPEMTNGATTSIRISELIENGVIENNNILDLKTNETIDGCIVITYRTNYNQYEYNYAECNE